MTDDSVSVRCFALYAYRPKYTGAVVLPFPLSMIYGQKGLHLESDVDFLAHWDTDC